MSASRPDSPWDVLGIAPTTDRQRIRHAYLIQVRLNHPDRFGMDPARFRAQEDRMRTINLAYQQALREAEPPATPKTEKNSTPWQCLEHGQVAQQRCQRCGTGICALCVGRHVGLCNRHLAETVFVQCRRRAVREWIPFLSIVLVETLLRLPTALSLALVATYMFGLGLFRIRFSGWRGLLYLWIFPFGLIASGFYSLYESLDQLNRAHQDETLWRHFLSRERAKI